MTKQQMALVDRIDLDLVLDICDAKIENDEECVGFIFSESAEILESKMSELDEPDREMAEHALAYHRAVVRIRAAESVESIQNDDLLAVVCVAEDLATELGDALEDRELNWAAINRVRSATDAAMKGEGVTNMLVIISANDGSRFFAHSDGSVTDNIDGPAIDLGWQSVDDFCADRCAQAVNDDPGITPFTCEPGHAGWNDDRYDMLEDWGVHLCDFESQADIDAACESEARVRVWKGLPLDVGDDGIQALRDAVASARASYEVIDRMREFMNYQMDDILLCGSVAQLRREISMTRLRRWTTDELRVMARRYMAPLHGWTLQYIDGVLEDIPLTVEEENFYSAVRAGMVILEKERSTTLG